MPEVSQRDGEVRLGRGGAAGAKVAHAMVGAFEEADVRVNGTRPWDLQAHDHRLWRRLAVHGSLGLGESYMDGWWDCEALDEMVCRLIRHRGKWKRAGWLSLAVRWLGSAVWNMQRVSRAFRVGEAHYDIGNDLYQRMLDKRMIYSCAYWRAGAKTLDEAQRDKLDLICRKMELQPGMRVLDIGCGWGGFCQYAAIEYGVECVGLTVSREQATWAEEACDGLPVEIRLQDYREVAERFDRIVSVGMFEHVGPKNYRTFMEVAERCLEERGLMLLHTIGSNDSYRVTDGFISRYIFPNGHLPSVAQIGRAVEGLLVVEDLHNFGPDYDRTLQAWHERVEAAWEALSAGDSGYNERFRRMWRYYLLACAGAFRARHLQLWQWVFSKGDREWARD